MSKLDVNLQQFRKGIERLRESLALEKSDLVRDSAILRFEIAMDLSWKLLKAFMEERLGVVCLSPKGCFREAFRQNLISYDEGWLDYVDMRNQTAHTYNEGFANELYARLPQVLKKLESLLDSLQTHQSTN